HIAHRKVDRRGRVGHEKAAPPDYLSERKVQIVFRGSPLWRKYRRLEQELSVYEPGMFRLQLGDYTAHLLAYDNALMERLKRFPDVEFFEYPQFLDRYLARIDSIPLEQVRKDAEFLQVYYFDFNEDHERKAKLLARLHSPNP
ncbi:MAG TPA: hypothetical protein VFR10_10045, partial [bacterium]|nr:hypothetical protein [bacterium]